MNKIEKKIYVTAAVTGFIAIILGTLAAHGLENLKDTDSFESFQTGVRYQIYHSLALISLGLMAYIIPNLKLSIIGYLFTSGILLFSGSLYILVLTNLRWFGAITPFGGLCFIFGWIILAIKIFKS